MHTILLVDDDSGVRKSVGDMLERSGYGVLKAEDGGSAMTVLQARDDIDLVIADYRMPGMDGLLLLRRIKERDPDLPVILMTGYSDLESYLCATGLGVVRYIGKPVGLRELQKTVRDAVG
jgi:two-component system response regulator (stage 0 sporulation protein F)